MAYLPQSPLHRPCDRLPLNHRHLIRGNPLSEISIWTRCGRSCKTSSRNWRSKKRSGHAPPPRPPRSRHLDRSLSRMLKSLGARDRRDERDWREEVEVQFVHVAPFSRVSPTISGRPDLSPLFLGPLVEFSS